MCKLATIETLGIYCVMYLLLTIYFYYKDGKTVHKKEKVEEITVKNICSQGGEIQEMCEETHLPSALKASKAGAGWVSPSASRAGPSALYL